MATRITITIPGHLTDQWARIGRVVDTGLSVLGTVTVERFAEREEEEERDDG